MILIYLLLWSDVLIFRKFFCLESALYIQNNEMPARSARSQLATTITGSGESAKTLTPNL